jgi:hypothetical protein
MDVILQCSIWFVDYTNGLSESFYCQPEASIWVVDCTNSLYE